MANTCNKPEEQQLEALMPRSRYPAFLRWLWRMWLRLRLFCFLRRRYDRLVIEEAARYPLLGFLPQKSLNERAQKSRPRYVGRHRRCRSMQDLIHDLVSRVGFKRGPSRHEEKDRRAQGVEIRRWGHGPFSELLRRH